MDSICQRYYTKSDYKLNNNNNNNNNNNETLQGTCMMTNWIL